MHAAERYEGVRGKLEECNDQLESTKVQTREVVARFEEVKKHRQQLFQVSVLVLVLVLVLGVQRGRRYNAF